MLRIVLSLVAAAGTLAGAASARTIRIADVLANSGGMAEGGFLDLGEVQVQFGNGARLSGAASAPSAAAHTAISVNSGFRISNLRFDDFARGSLTMTGRTLLINNVSQRFADVGGLALSGPVINIGSGGADPTRFELEAFDVEPVVTPIPAAGVLMIAGLAGFGFASRKKKET